MAGPEILVPISFFAMAAIMYVGGPIARAHARRIERGKSTSGVTPEVAERLERIEHAVESIALEVERISEGQRFTTRLLSQGNPAAVPPAGRIES